MSEPEKTPDPNSPEETITPVVRTWYGIAQGDVGETLTMCCVKGDPIVTEDPGQAAQVAQALADRDRTIFRVYKITEAMRVRPALRASTELS
jgi:hypothetical protein